MRLGFGASVSIHFWFFDDKKKNKKKTGYTSCIALPLAIHLIMFACLPAFVYLNELVCGFSVCECVRRQLHAYFIFDTNYAVLNKLA